MCAKTEQKDQEKKAQKRSILTRQERQSVVTGRSSESEDKVQIQITGRCRADRDVIRCREQPAGPQLERKDLSAGGAAVAASAPSPQPYSNLLGDL